MPGEVFLRYTAQRKHPAAPQSRRTNSIPMLTKELGTTVKVAEPRIAKITTVGAKLLSVHV